MEIWARPDILAQYREIINYPALRPLRDNAAAMLTRPRWTQLREALRTLPYGSDLRARGAQAAMSLDSPVVSVGCAGELTASEQHILTRVIELLIPWRKGPFSLFGVEIDSEWRSDFKWSRIAPHLDSLDGKRVLDAGCGNGYYMWRMAARNPECIIGVDPSEPFYFAFELFQRFIEDHRLQYELFGAEQLTHFPEFFDVVLCLGVVYHQRSPIDLLRVLHAAMRPGAQLILESQAIPGSGPAALFPPDRYAKARNVYFVPTADCLAAWAARAGFDEIDVFSSAPLTPDEQRRTLLAPYESLADFLDPSDSSKTVEGFPAPLRVALKARKR